MRRHHSPTDRGKDIYRIELRFEIALRLRQPRFTYRPPQQSQRFLRPTAPADIRQWRAILKPNKCRIVVGASQQIKDRIVSAPIRVAETCAQVQSRINDNREVTGPSCARQLKSFYAARLSSSS